MINQPMNPSLSTTIRKFLYSKTMKTIFKILLILGLNIWLIIKLFSGSYGLSSALIWGWSIFFLYKTAPPPSKNVHPKFHLPSPLFFLLILIFLVKVIFIIFFPQSIPFHGDEAINSRNAQLNFESGINHNEWNILGSGFGTLNQMPALWYFLQGGIIHFLNPSLLSTKIFALVSDLFLCCLLYLIIKHFFNKYLAYLSVIIYISFPIAIHFSLTSYQNIQSTLFLFWSVYLLCLIPRRPNYRDLIYYCLTSGIVCGVSLYFYLSSNINPLICLLIIFALFIFEYHQKFIFKIKHLFTSIGCFSAGLIIPAIPYIHYSIYKYNYIAGRSGEFIFNQSNFNWIGTLIFQFKEFFQGFLPSGFFNGSGQHYVNASLFPGIVLFFCFIIGFLLCLTRFKQKKYFIPLIIFITTSVTGGILTKDPPAPQRLIHLFPVLVYFIILAINLVKNKRIQGIIIVYLLIMNIYYFISQNIPLYQQQSNQDAYEVSEILSQDTSKLSFIAPIHKKDQIYYYSQGKIDSQSFDGIPQKESANFKLSGSYFVDNINFLTLNDYYPSSAYTIVKEWPLYDHTLLLKFN